MKKCAISLEAADERAATQRVVEERMAMLQASATCCFYMPAHALV